MGSEVHMGLDFVDSIAGEPHVANEEGSCEAEGLSYTYCDEDGGP